MPVNIQLCEDEKRTPAKSTAFDLPSGVKVFKLFTNPPEPAPEQPTNLTATGFTLKLSPGSYDVVMVVISKSDMRPSYVFENCAGNNELAQIPKPPSGHFTLRVI